MLLSVMVAVAVTVAMAAFDTLPAMVTTDFVHMTMAMAMTTAVIKAYIRCTNINADVGAAVAGFSGCGCSAHAKCKCGCSSDCKYSFAEHDVHPFSSKVTQV
jgi:hypothetical protein